MASAGPVVTFRVDARQETGLGHLRRCLTLADDLRSRDCETRIVCGEPFAPAVGTLVGQHPVICIRESLHAAASGQQMDAEAADANATLAVIGKGHDASWVVVDSYVLGIVWERAVRAAGHRVMAIDDFRDRRHYADLLVSDTEMPFDARLNDCAGSRSLVGRRYTLIGPEYAYRAGANPRNGPPRLLISYGGSDPTSETLKAIAAIDALRGSQASLSVASVDIVVGQFNPRGKEIAAAARRIECERVHVHYSPPGLAQLLRDTDLFLTAGGNSLAEALALRKPCLVTVTADNQRQMVHELAAEGMIRVAGTHDDTGVAELSAAIVQTCAQLGEFVERVASCVTFDHLGAGRIAEILLSSRTATRSSMARMATGSRSD